MSDRIHAHALGILLDAPIPEPALMPSRTAQRAAHTAALQGSRHHLADQVATLKQELDAALLSAADWRKATDKWCSEAQEHQRSANVWCFIAAAATVALLGWIAGSVRR